ncbi:MAG: sigma-70 family RNA polymerase sigma factor [Polyangiaceae bacterium]
MNELDEAAERRFIERLQQRDERAFIELVQLYQVRVYKLVLRMVGRRDEAEDMAQEVFVQVFKAVGTFRGDSRLSTWIYRIAVNLCKNRLKYLTRRRSEAQDEFEASQRSQRARRCARCHQLRAVAPRPHGGGLPNGARGGALDSTARPRLSRNLGAA